LHLTFFEDRLILQDSFIDTTPRKRWAASVAREARWVKILTAWRRLDKLSSACLARSSPV
jgi:hypothetical protein